MKLYIISGEASGDLHGSNLVKFLKQKEPHLEIRAWGGDLMEAQGAKIVKHYRDLAFMGFVEVLLNLRTILKNISFCKEDILSYQPDALVLIDYPGFNLRMAEWAHKKGIKVYYYISPQIWAWKQSRVHKIKKYVDEMFVILPFEKDFYKRFDYEVDFVGHPLIDAIESFKQEQTSNDEFLQELGFERQDKIIALLPGSRKQEIAVMLPIMLKAIGNFLEYKIVVGGAPSQEAPFYEAILASSDNPFTVVFNQTYKLLNVAHAALVTSGTATLETALFKVPQVVCYKGGYLSYVIAKNLVKVKYISLVNLIADKEVVKELIQVELTEKNLLRELTGILEGAKRASLLKQYNQLIEKMGGVGASQNTANAMLKTLK